MQCSISAFLSEGNIFGQLTNFSLFIYLLSSSVKKLSIVIFSPLLFFANSLFLICLGVIEF